MAATSKAARLILVSLAVFVFFLGENNPRASHASTGTSTLLKDGMVMIESLLPITNHAGNLLENYVVIAEALVYEIENINRRTDVLPTIKLGYEIIDDMGENLHLIVNRAIGIVSTHRPRRSVCYSDDDFCTKAIAPSKRQVSALIGPATSANTVPVASLLGLYSIPLVGYVASSSLLSDKSRFKSFLRTIPSDNYQAEALATFVRHFGWNYVFFIGNDDEYGREGLAAFKDAARKQKVCTADDVNIAFNSDDVAEQVSKAVEKIAKENRVQVVVLFMFGRQAARVIKEAERQGASNITWIFSDGVGGSLLKYLAAKELVNGAFAVDFVSRRIADFERHLANVSVSTAKGNPWMTRLLEETLNCSTLIGAGKRRCQDDEKLNLTVNAITNSWSAIVNIINGVKAVAYGLDNLMKCRDGYGLLEGGRCPNSSLPVAGKDLYMYIRNASFPGAMNETVAFDDKGDLVTKEYIFRNYVYDRLTDTVQFHAVANWSSTLPGDVQFHAGVTWKRDVKPQATCSRVCLPGEMKVGQSDCCWACHPCQKGEISNHTGATYCTKCPVNHYANNEQTKCVEIGVEFVDASDPFSIVIIVISCFGLLAIVAISLLFLHVRDTPLVRDSDETLLGLFLLSTILAFTFPIFQVTLYRSDSVCRFLGALLLYTVLLVATTLLAKTKTCNNHLEQFMSYFAFLKPAAQYYNLIVVVAALFFQLLLLGVWYLTDSPNVHMVEQTRAVYLRECSAHWPAARFIAYGFPLVVLFLATVFAFKERNSRENHSEAKYVSFCTISMCILLIAFFPTYRFVKGITTSVVIATTSLVGAFAVTGCILLPKVYVLLFRPERNVPGHERSNEPTVSSAHTAGSHQGSSSGHHYEGTEKQPPRGPRDIDLTSS